MGILSKIFSSGASEVVEKVMEGADNLFTSKEEKIKLTNELTIKLAEFDLEREKLAEQQIEAYLKDTQSARDANVKIQESDKASWLSKNVGYILDIFFPIAFAIILIMIFKRQVPEDNKEIFYMLVGLLGGYVSQVVGFHRGTSRGSEKKQDSLEKLMSK